MTENNVSTLPTNYKAYFPSKNLDPFFDVSRLPVFAKSNTGDKEIAKDALFSPNGDVLGLVSKGYNLVNNVDVASLFDEFFSEMNVHSVKDHVSGNGEKWMRDYVVDEDKYSVTIDKDDHLKLKVTVSNGYDAKSGVKFAVSFWRQVCDNGMMGWKREIGQSFSHFNKNILGSLDEILNQGFGKVSEFADTWQSWTQIPFTKKDFVGFVESRDYLTDKKKNNTVSYYDGIMNKYNENETKWGAYNVLTAIATHYTNSRNNSVSNIFSNGYREMQRVTRDFWNY